MTIRHIERARFRAWLTRAFRAQVFEAIENRSLSKSQARKLGLLQNPYKQRSY